MKTYKKAEKAVINFFNSKKDCCAFRFQDTADVNSQLGRFGSNQGMVYVEKNPSDFIVIERGTTYFAEAKSTENVKGVTSSLFDQQRGYRNRILSCGGKYYYFVYSITRARWYKIPGDVIRDNANRTWEDLAVYRYGSLEAI